MNFPRHRWSDGYLAMRKGLAKCGNDLDKLGAYIGRAIHNIRINEFRQSQRAHSGGTTFNDIPGRAARESEPLPVFDRGSGSEELNLFVRGLSHKQIAAALGTTPQNVKSRIFHARVRMKEAA